ncbi:MAG: hypothetical protein UEP31_11550 [Anaerovoracaceae bacterium]|nr:hypothetical protein [Anaerovoracaceae bacterium]
MADIAASVLAKLKNKARALGVSYQQCLQLFVQEEFLTRREQEIPILYRWRDELRLTRRFLDSCILLYYDIFTISRI